MRYSLELTAARFGLSMEETDEVLAEGRGRLAEVRKTRPPPHLDTKMLSSWNGEGGGVWFPNNIHGYMGRLQVIEI